MSWHASSSTPWSRQKSRTDPARRSSSARSLRMAMSRVAAGSIRSRASRSADLTFLDLAVDEGQVLVHLLDAAENLLRRQRPDDFEDLLHRRNELDEQDPSPAGAQRLFRVQHDADAGAADERDLGHVEDDDRRRFLQEGIDRGAQRGMRVRVDGPFRLDRVDARRLLLDTDLEGHGSAPACDEFRVPNRLYYIGSPRPNRPDFRRIASSRIDHASRIPPRPGRRRISLSPHLVNMVNYRGRIRRRSR